MLDVAGKRNKKVNNNHRWDDAVAAQLYSETVASVNVRPGDVVVEAFFGSLPTTTDTTSAPSRGQIRCETEKDLLSDLTLLLSGFYPLFVGPSVTVFNAERENLELTTTEKHNQQQQQQDDSVSSPYRECVGIHDKDPDTDPWWKTLSRKFSSLRAAAGGDHRGGNDTGAEEKRDVAAVGAVGAVGAKGAGGDDASWPSRAALEASVDSALGRMSFGKSGDGGDTGGKKKKKKPKEEEEQILDDDIVVVGTEDDVFRARHVRVFVADLLRARSPAFRKLLGGHLMTTVNGKRVPKRISDCRALLRDLMKINDWGLGVAEALATIEVELDEIIARAKKVSSSPSSSSRSPEETAARGDALRSEFRRKSERVWRTVSLLNSLRPLFMRIPDHLRVRAPPNAPEGIVVRGAMEGLVASGFVCWDDAGRAYGPPPPVVATTSGHDGGNNNNNDDAADAAALGRPPRLSDWKSSAWASVAWTSDRVLHFAGAESRAVLETCCWMLAPPDEPERATDMLARIVSRVGLVADPNNTKLDPSSAGRLTPLGHELSLVARVSGQAPEAAACARSVAAKLIALDGNDGQISGIVFDAPSASAPMALILLRLAMHRRALRLLRSGGAAPACSASRSSDRQKSCLRETDAPPCAALLGGSLTDLVFCPMAVSESTTKAEANDDDDDDVSLVPMFRCAGSVSTAIKAVGVAARLREKRADLVAASSESGAAGSERKLIGQGGGLLVVVSLCPVQSESTADTIGAISHDEARRCGFARTCVAVAARKERCPEIANYDDVDSEFASPCSSVASGPATPLNNEAKRREDVFWSCVSPPKK